MAERTLTLRIGADFEKLISGATKAARAVEAAGKRIQDLGGQLTKTVTAPIVALGGAVLYSATQFEEADRIIRLGTGATGAALGHLEGVFRQVYGTVPATAQEAATAVADLSTRLGLTGAPLATMSQRMLQLARVAGVDVHAAVGSMSGLFQSWGVSTQHMSGWMDFLHKTAQATGVGVLQLADGVTKNGATFRALGIPLQQAVVMLGQFERGGVNAETVLAGLSRAARSFAQDSIPNQHAIRAADQAAQSASVGIGSAQLRIREASEGVRLAQGKQADAWAALQRAQALAAASTPESVTAQQRLSQALRDQRLAQEAAARADSQLAFERSKVVSSTEAINAAQARAEQAHGRLDRATRSVGQATNDLARLQVTGSSSANAIEAAQRRWEASTQAAARAQRSLEAAQGGLTKAHRSASAAAEKAAGSRKVVASFADELVRVFTSIQQAPGQTEAYAQAVAVFGKSGIQMADAIRRGQLSVSDLLKTVAASPETIAKAEESTRTFAQRWALLKDNVLKALEPLGVQLMKALDRLQPLFRSMIGYLTRAVEAFAALPQHTQDQIVQFVALAAAIGPVLSWLGATVSAAVGVGSAFGAMATAIGGAFAPVMATLAGIKALIVTFAGGVMAALNTIGFGGLVSGLASAATALATILGPIALAAGAVLALAYNWTWVKDRVLWAVEALGRGVIAAFRWMGRGVITILEGIGGPIAKVVQWAVDRVKPALKALPKAFSAVWNEVARVTKRAFDGIVSALRRAARDVGEAFQRAFLGILKTARTIWSVVGPILQRIFGGNAGSGQGSTDLAGVMASILESSGRIESALGRISGELQRLVSSPVGAILSAIDLLEGRMARYVAGFEGAFGGNFDINFEEGYSEGYFAAQQIVPLLNQQLVAQNEIATAVRALVAADRSAHMVDRLTSIQTLEQRQVSLLTSIAGVLTEIATAAGAALVPPIDVPALASGGIVRQPTLALIGEAGPEAVVPLDRASAATVVNVYVSARGSIVTRRDLVDDMRRELQDVIRTNGTSGIS